MSDFADLDKLEALCAELRAHASSFTLKQQRESGVFPSLLAAAADVAHAAAAELRVLRQSVTDLQARGTEQLEAARARAYWGDALYRHSKGGLYRLLFVAESSEQRGHEFAVYWSQTYDAYRIRPKSKPLLEGDDCWDDRIVWPDGLTRLRFVREGTIAPRELATLETIWARAKEEKADATK